MIKTTATDKIFSLRKRIRGVSGGTSASKTISILLWMIQRAQTNDNELLSVVSETFPHLKRGAIRDFLNIMEEHGYYKDDRWNKTDFIYTFETGSKIEFFSADQPSKVRGPRRDILFINEANNIAYETFTQLEIRTKKIIWLDWNPVQEFWWYTEVQPNMDHDFLTLTYKDNNALDPAIVAAIEARKGNKNWWKVYGLGELGMTEGVIYSHLLPIAEVPPEARLVRYGLDFGYTNDPTACVAIYQWNNSYIWDEVIYRKGLSNKDISDMLINLDKALVVADSSEPKSIDELKSYGINAIGSQKGQGSVLQGIQYVQDQKIFVTNKSTNIWHEQRNYLWLTDKEGKIINEPSPFLNHCFVGNTEIRTIDGYKHIKDINKGDWVLTSSGARPVTKRWNNGLKQVNKYSLQFDTFSVTIEATPDHLIKTTKGWKKISQLQSGMMVYHNNFLGGKPTISTQKKSIFHEVTSECIQKFGNTTMEQFLKGITYTIRMAIHGIIDFLTLPWLRTIRILPFIATNGWQIIPNGLNPFKRKVFKQQRLGMLALKDLIGIANMAKEHGLIDNSENLSVLNVDLNMKQGIAVYPNIAIQTAKLKHLDVEEGKKKRVYDLSVRGCHEYFANTILVHNCMDAGRYGMESLRPMDPLDQELYGNDYQNINAGLNTKWRL